LERCGVGEREHCIERAVILTNDDVSHLPPPAESTGTANGGDLHEALNNLERELILEALKSSRGNQTKAARLLGITERVMGLRVKNMALGLNDFLPKSNFFIILLPYCIFFNCP